MMQGIGSADEIAWIYDYDCDVFIDSPVIYLCKMKISNWLSRTEIHVANDLRYAYRERAQKN